MDAIGSNDDVCGLVRKRRANPAPDETCEDMTIRRLFHVRQMVAGPDQFDAEPLAHRARQNHLKVAAVNRELRPGITRLETARLTPNLLAEFVVKG